MEDDREYSIYKVGKYGLSIGLDNGSCWQISEGDSTMSCCWYPTMRVTVSESQEDEVYPYRITNLDTSGPDVVRARRK